MKDKSFHKSAIEKMQAVLLLIYMLLAKHAVSTQQICIVLIGNDENCYVDVENSENIENFTVAAHTLAGAIDSNNEVDFEIAKDHMGAWLEILNFRRKEFRNYLLIQRHRNGGKIKLHATGRCGSDLSLEQNHKGYLKVGSNILDLFNRKDWNNQVGNKVIDNILISEYVWAQQLLVRPGGMQNLKALVDNALEYIKSGSGHAILFSTPHYARNSRLEALLKFLHDTYSHLHSLHKARIMEARHWYKPINDIHLRGHGRLSRTLSRADSAERSLTKMHKELCAKSILCRKNLRGQYGQENRPVQ